MKQFIAVVGITALLATFVSVDGGGSLLSSKADAAGNGGGKGGGGGNGGGGNGGNGGGGANGGNGGNGGGGGGNGGAAGNGGGQGAQAGGKGLSSGKVNAADKGNSAAAHAAKADPMHPSALGALNGFFNASEAARLNANAKSAVGKISKTYAEKLTAYLGLDPAATESARTTALAELAAALADASNKPVSAEIVSAINTRLAEQDPALATALASADPTLNQSIADTASALSRTGGEQEATGGEQEATGGEQEATGGEQEPVDEPTVPN